MTSSKKIFIPLLVLFGLYLLFRGFQFYSAPLPQDFHVYYFSALTDSLGKNPYNTAHVSEVSEKLVRFPFVYPPYTLPVLKQLNYWEWETSARIYLTLKILLLILVMRIWQKLSKGMNLSAWAQILAMVSVGYYECVYRDFRHGNISIIEQFCVWLGVLAFTQRRYYLYGLGIFLASFFKLALIPLIGVLLFVPNRKGWGPFLLSSFAFISLQAGSYFFQTDLYMQFLTRSTGLVEPGPLNPSAMMFSRALFGFLGKNTANLIYVAFFLAVTAYFLKYFWPRKKTNEAPETFAPLDIFIGFCLFYATVMPRFKDYSYTMLIFPTYWVLNELLDWSEKRKWLFVFFVVVHLFAYQSWVLVALLFFWWTKETSNNQITRPSSAETA